MIVVLSGKKTGKGKSKVVGDINEITADVPLKTTKWLAKIYNKMMNDILESMKGVIESCRNVEVILIVLK